MQVILFCGILNYLYSWIFIGNAQHYHWTGQERKVYSNSYTYSCPGDQNKKIDETLEIKLLFFATFDFETTYLPS